MKIESLDKWLAQDMSIYRTCKIKYSFAFENYISNKLLLLKKDYNIYTIDELFTESNNTSVMNISHC